MTLRSHRSIRADALARAALASAWPQPLPTGVIAERIGMPGDPVVLRMLHRLAASGTAEKTTRTDMKSLYWRLTAAPQDLLAPAASAAPGAATARSRKDRAATLNMTGESPDAHTA
jgi:hypothetical protein